MLKKIFLRVFELGIFTFLSLPTFVQAAAYKGLSGSQDTLTAIQTGGAATANVQLPSMIGKIIGVILGILGIILVVYIVQAGILYMTAGGDTEKVKKAKLMIQQAVIGMIIIVAAYSISSFVIT